MMCEQVFVDEVSQIHDDGARPQVLLTVHGRGYMFSLKRKSAARSRGTVDVSCIDES